MAGHLPQSRTDGEKIIGPDELFFSTTDRRGVISQANSVFSRISGYSRDELLGAPHNIVRHPDMPAGAFRLTWDRLAAGRPVGAYVQNRAKDGSTYWVFATMSPLHDGYISVRMAPRDPLFDAAKEVYAEALEAERDAAWRQGLNRVDTALVGAANIEAALRRLGFPTFDDFMLAALPAEVSARGTLVRSTYARPGATGSFREILAGTGAVDEMLGDLVGRLTAYQKLGTELSRTSSQVLEIAHRLERSVTAAQEASERVADTAPVLANVARVMAAPMHKVGSALEWLQPELGELRSDVAELRFRISLASLYNDMVAAFAAEAVDNMAHIGSLQTVVPLLCDAAHFSVMKMSAQVQHVNEELHNVAGLVDEAGQLLQAFRRFLGQWRILVTRHKAGPMVGDMINPIDAEIAASWDWMEMMYELGEQFQSAVVPFDPDRLESYLARIRSVARSSDGFDLGNRWSGIKPGA